MVGRLALLSGDLDTAGVAIEWACRLDPSNPVFRQAAQGVLRHRHRQHAAARLYREAKEALGQTFGHRHSLVARLADAFAKDFGGAANQDVSREACRRALVDAVTGGPRAPSLGGASWHPKDVPLCTGEPGRMSELARYIHEILDATPADD